MGSKHIRNPCTLMPRGVIKGEEDGLVERGRLRPRAGAQRRGKGALEPGCFRKPRALLGLGWPLD